jgi:hypothetical protein
LHNALFVELVIGSSRNTGNSLYLNIAGPSFDAVGKIVKVAFGLSDVA